MVASEVLTKSQLEEVKIQASKTMKLRDRRFLFHTYPNAFTGFEIVDWIRENRKVSRHTAIAIAKQMIEEDLAKPVSTNKISRCNGFTIFQWTKALVPAVEDVAVIRPEEMMDVHEWMGTDSALLRYRVMSSGRSASGTDILEWLSKRLSITPARAQFVANSMLTAQFMVLAETCGRKNAKTVMSERSYYKPANLPYLDVIKQAIKDDATVLSLQGFGLTSGVPKLSELEHLTSLDMSRNSFECMCVYAFAVPDLEVMNFSKNRISRIAQDIGTMTRLKRLDLSHNLLESLPSEIGTITTLETLNLANNKLTSLPSSFSALTNLKELFLNNNSLSEVPPVLEGYKSLLKLDLSDNTAITVVPAFLASFKSLKFLGLARLSILQLPFLLGLLRDLETINIAGCTKITCPSPGFCNAPSALILNFLKDMLSSDGEEDKSLPCTHVRLMVLGKENTGKTSLLRALQNEKKSLFAGNKLVKSLSTDGVEIGFWRMEHDKKSSSPKNAVKKSNSERSPSDSPKSESGTPTSGRSSFSTPTSASSSPAAAGRSVDSPRSPAARMNSSPLLPLEKSGIFKKKQLMKKRMMFSTWDFAGQEVYSITHEFFLSNTSMYLVVWDARFTIENSGLDFWLQSINARAPDAPILLVGTHIDLVKNSSKAIADVEEHFKGKYPQILQAFGASVTSNDGVKALRHKIKEVSSEESAVVRRVPAKFFALSQILQSQKKSPPVCTFEEFKEMAKMADITDEQQVKRALISLHDTGFIMNSPEESLRDLIILNPQWLTNCFSTFISSKTNFINNGVLDLKNLPFIWRTEDFPKHLWPTILKLLSKFEVVHLKGQSSSQLQNLDEMKAVVPALLPVRRPSTFVETVLEQYVGHPRAGRSYEFKYITKGFFPRLLARLMHFGATLECWRYGIVMHDGTEGSALDAKKHSLTIVEYDESKFRLSVMTSGAIPSAVSEFFIQVLESVSTLISDWPKIEAEVTVPCSCSPSCKTNPQKYQLQVIEELVLNGSTYIECPSSGRHTNLEFLAPDITMTHINSNRIDASEILDITQIGRGSFANVYSGTFRGEKVAVKQLFLNEEDETSSRSLGSSSSLSDLGSSGLLLSSGGTYSSGGGTPKVFSAEARQNVNEFRREVWLMSNMHHPNIVDMKGYCLDPYSIVMEQMDLGSLSSYIHAHKDTITREVSLSIALDIARGMEFLHSASPPLVHRDLKSPNVLLQTTAEGGVIAKVSDFGLSRSVVDSFVTKVVDNPIWNAPEVIRKDPYNEKADVYSFGIILWELLTLARPFDEYKIRFTYQMEDKIVEGLRPTIPPTCSPAYKSLMESCWSDSPIARPDFSTIVRTLSSADALKLLS